VEVKLLVLLACDTDEAYPPAPSEAVLWIPFLGPLQCSLTLCVTIQEPDQNFANFLLCPGLVTGVKSHTFPPMFISLAS
jgi:hypothetical protein